MLEQETELWVEAVWDSMSETLRKRVVAAVDTGLMNAEEPNHLPDAVVTGLTGGTLDEAERLSGERGVLREVPLGRHDSRSGVDECRTFAVSRELRTYVLVRVLL